MLHKHSIAKGELQDYWQKRSALRPKSIGRAIFTEATLKAIRREIHHHDEVLIDEEDLAQAIHEMFSDETQAHPRPAQNQVEAPSRGPCR